MDDLNHKIQASIGRHRKHHCSEMDQIPNNSVPLLKRPDRRGYFTLNTVVPQSQSEPFKVFQGGTCLGVMNYNAILQKFGEK